MPDEPQPRPACIRCQQAVPAGSSTGGLCLDCWRESRRPPTPVPWNLFIAAAAILLPLAGMTLRPQDDGWKAGMLLIAAPALSLVAGIILGVRIGSTAATKLALAFVLTGVLGICSVTITGYGCTMIR